MMNLVLKLSTENAFKCKRRHTFNGKISTFFVLLSFLSQALSFHFYCFCFQVFHCFITFSSLFQFVAICFMSCCCAVSWNQPISNIVFEHWKVCCPSAFLVWNAWPTQILGIQIWFLGFWKQEGERTTNMKQKWIWEMYWKRLNNWSDLNCLWWLG